MVMRLRRPAPNTDPDALHGRTHRGAELPEEMTGHGHRKDVLASIGSAVVILGGTALLAWALFSLLG